MAQMQMKAFDHYFGLRGLLDEVEVFIWPELTETDNWRNRCRITTRTAQLQRAMSYVPDGLAGIRQTF